MLHQLKSSPGSTHRRRRVGRGSGAGGGTTAGRGTKGQQARAGKGRRLGFEGGQNPLLRRQPKLGGFRHPAHTTFEVVNLDDLEKRLKPGSYDVAALRANRIVRTKRPVKILGRGNVSKAFELTVHAVSKHAKQAIEKSGGKVILK